MWTKPFTLSVLILRVLFPEPCNLCDRWGTWWKGRCRSDRQISGASFGANDSSFKLQTKTAKHCVAPVAFFFSATRLCSELVCARVLGCLFLSELSRCADSEGAGFIPASPAPPPIPFCHWFVGFGFPTCLGLLWKTNRGDFKKSECDGADAVKNKKTSEKSGVLAAISCL